MSMGELIFIGIVILLVVPPEKLPGLARELGRFFNDFRRTTAGVWDEIKKDTPNPMEELRKQKQEVTDYVKTIGAVPEHHVDNSTFQPVDTSSPYREPTTPTENLSPVVTTVTSTIAAAPMPIQNSTPPTAAADQDDERTDKK